MPEITGVRERRNRALVSVDGGVLGGARRRCSHRERTPRGGPNSRRRNSSGCASRGRSP